MGQQGASSQGSCTSDNAACSVGFSLLLLPSHGPAASPQPWFLGCPPSAYGQLPLLRSVGSALPCSRGTPIFLFCLPSRSGRGRPEGRAERRSLLFSEGLVTSCTTPSRRVRCCSGQSQGLLAASIVLLLQQTTLAQTKRAELRDGAQWPPAANVSFCPPPAPPGACGPGVHCGAESPGSSLLQLSPAQ